MDPKQIVLDVWSRLATVKRVSFCVKNSAVQWKGSGEGEVLVSKEAGILIFQEKGFWAAEENQQVAFTNTLRWTLDLDGALISLEHLRRGPRHPVFLVHLKPTSNTCLVSVDSHLCGADIYFGRLQIDPERLCLNWRIVGPKKNEEIDYCYS